MFFTKLPSIALLVCAGMLAACGSSSTSTGTDSGESDSNGTARSNSVVNGFRLVRSTQYNEFDVVQQTNELSYDSETNTVTNVQIESYGPGIPERKTTNVMQYNELGRGRVTQIEYFSDGESHAIENFTFDDSNKIVESERDGYISYRSTFEFDSAGNILKWVSIRTKLEAEFGEEYVPSSIVYTYDDNGHLQSATAVFSGFSSGSLFVYRSEAQYTTSDTGQLLRFERQDADGSAPWITMYNYDGNGNMVERTTTSGDYYRREVAEYEPNEEPVYNHWLRRFKYFP